MKPLNKKGESVNGLFYNEQNLPEKGNATNFIKTITLVITLSVATFFSKQIQDILISNYNKSAAFVQKHSSSAILPIGA